MNMKILRRCFRNHQDEGNLLNRTNFLTNSILWQPVDGQHIIHACKVLAREAFQRRDITEEIYRERFHMRKARFVVYKQASSLYWFLCSNH
jgi:hypothetical protein